MRTGIINLRESNYNSSGCIGIGTITTKWGVI